jgi:hypothetical protein
MRRSSVCSTYSGEFSRHRAPSAASRIASNRRLEPLADPVPNGGRNGFQIPDQTAKRHQFQQVVGDVEFPPAALARDAKSPLPNQAGELHAVPNACICGGIENAHLRHSNVRLRGQSLDRGDQPHLDFRLPSRTPNTLSMTNMTTLSSASTAKFVTMKRKMRFTSLYLCRK